MAVYTDVEDALITWLPTVLTDLTVTPHYHYELPYNLSFVLPLLVVERISGPDDVFGLDRATVDVDVFHQTKPAAKLLAEQVRRALRFQLPGTVLGGSAAGPAAAVSRVETVNGPSIAPWDNTQMRRITATYRITVHSPL